MVIDAVPAAASNFNPLLTTIGFDGLVGFLLGFVIKKLMKILAIVAGIFFAALMYLEQQGIVNVNWDKLQGASQGVLSTVVNTVTTGGLGGSPAPSSLLPTNLGIVLSYNGLIALKNILIFICILEPLLISY